MRGLISNSYWVVFVTLSALGLTGCNTESGGSSGPSIQTDPFFCAGGVCSLARGVALNEEYATTVQDELALGNVILKAANGSELMLTHAIEWNSTHALTLQANNDIYIQGGITSTAGQLVIDNPGHEYHLRQPVNLSAGPNLRVNGDSYTVITELGAEGSTTGIDLQGMDGDLSANYALGADINAGSTENWHGGSGFKPIGWGSAAFTGDFTGLGHVISGLTINSTTNDNIGFFGVLIESTIRDVAIRSATIVGKNNVGTLAGRVEGNSRISGSCILGGDVTAVGTVAGGFVGLQNAPLTITESCLVRTSISRTDVAGGFLGRQVAGTTTIRQSYFAGRFGGTDNNSINTGVYVGEFTAQPDVIESIHYLSGYNLPGGSPSGSTQLFSAGLSHLAPYKNANWDISDDPNQKSLWFLDVTRNPYLLPILRVFNIDMYSYNFDA